MYTSKRYDTEKNRWRKGKIINIRKYHFRLLWMISMFPICFIVQKKKKKNSDDVQGLYKTFSTIQNVFMMLRKDSLSWLVTMVTSKSKNYVWLGCTSQEELTRKKSFEKFKMEGRKILVLILCSCSLPWLS